MSGGKIREGALEKDEGGRTKDEEIGAARAWEFETFVAFHTSLFIPHPSAFFILLDKETSASSEDEALVENTVLATRLVRRSHRDRINIHPAAFAIETDGAVHEGEDGVVAAEADVLARHKLRAALTDDDVAGDDRLAAVNFNAEALADAVAPVLDGSLTFFMSHIEEVESW